MIDASNYNKVYFRSLIPYSNPKIALPATTHLKDNATK